jgi:hypothetical protein
MYVLLYVDDIIVVSSSPQATSALLHNLEKDFALKDIGELHFFIGIEITKINDGIMLSQSKYAEELLKKIGMYSLETATNSIVYLEKTLKLCWSSSWAS